MDILEVPEEPEFVVGGSYLRKELHNQFKGQRQYGISTPADESFVFVFTDTDTDEHGYSDRFREDGVFIYSGEGRVGPMSMDGGNERIRDHKENGDDLLVFEKVGEQNGADVFSYVGEYEYIDHYWEPAEDDQGTMREAIRFKLVPKGGVDVDITPAEVESLSDEELFQKAKQSAHNGDAESSSSTSTRSEQVRYTRSDVIRDFARRMADGECVGCGESAPFVDQNGEPFLEVHHLHRRSDGGPDDPENVIAICPNCHRRAHYGENKEEFNEMLIEIARDRISRLK